MGIKIIRLKERSQIKGKQFMIPFFIKIILKYNKPILERDQWLLGMLEGKGGRGYKGNKKELLR